VGNADRPVYIMTIQGYADATLETLESALASLGTEGIDVHVSPIETLIG
jgi:glycine cleavage system transcriptional repressor